MSPMQCRHKISCVAPALIHGRQREGIALAKQRGAYKGRKKALSAAAVTELRARIAAGVSKAKVAREFGISRQTLYQYLQGGDGAASPPSLEGDKCRDKVRVR
jgi:DNA invertase Pin-like site-specific DNA recombinase